MIAGQIWLGFVDERFSCDCFSSTSLYHIKETKRDTQETLQLIDLAGIIDE